MTQDDPNRGTAGFGYDLAGRQTSVTDALSNQVHTLYDEVGNLEEENVFLNGFSWRECYGFDERQRLTDAYTVTPTGDCDTGTPGDRGLRVRALV